MLDRVGGLLREVGLIVRASHERWDGGGYPDGLAGDEIPLEARIVAVLRRLQRDDHRPVLPRAMSVGAALEECRASAGTQFDPAVVDALVRVLSASRSA